MAGSDPFDHFDNFVDRGESSDAWLNALGSHVVGTPLPYAGGQLEAQDEVDQDHQTDLNGQQYVSQGGKAEAQDEVNRGYQQDLNGQQYISQGQAYGTQLQTASNQPREPYTQGYGLHNMQFGPSMSGQFSEQPVYQQPLMNGFDSTQTLPGHIHQPRPSDCNQPGYPNQQLSRNDYDNNAYYIQATNSTVNQQNFHPESQPTIQGPNNSYINGGQQALHNRPDILQPHDRVNDPASRQLSAGSFQNLAIGNNSTTFGTVDMAGNANNVKECVASQQQRAPNTGSMLKRRRDLSAAASTEYSSDTTDPRKKIKLAANGKAGKPKKTKKQAVALSPQAIAKIKEECGTVNTIVEGMSLAEARNITMVVEPLEFRIDNVDDVKKKEQDWLKRMLEAFNAEWQAESNVPGYVPALKPEWDTWQVNALEATSKIIKTASSRQYVEARVTNLFAAVVEAHDKTGKEKVGPYRMGTASVDATLTCSERLEAVIKFMGALTIIRQDVITGTRLYELVADPKGFASRKERNWWGNEISRKKEYAMYKQPKGGKTAKAEENDDINDDDDGGSEDVGGEQGDGRSKEVEGDDLEQ